jgi:hypothetical protein
MSDTRKVLNLAAGLGVILLVGCMRPAAPGDTAKVAPAVAAAMQALASGTSLAAPARSDAQGRLEIYVHVTEPSDELVKQLTALGLANAILSREMSVVEGWLAPRDLDGIARLAVVTRITLPRYARPQ